MNETERNREAWNEAYAVHQRGYGDSLERRLLDPQETFLDQPLIEALKRIGLGGKTVGQFCCNNGRELLSALQMGADAGIGFDFADQFVQEGRRLAELAGLNATFVATDIADIPGDYNNTCDIILVTAGAMTWFADLSLFFGKSAHVLQPGGILLIHEMHPFVNMLAMPDEEAYDPQDPKRLAFSYFRSEPWIDNSGLDYVGGTQYESKTFTSYSHSFSSIVNAMARSGFVIKRLDEYATDVSASFGRIENDGLPLSYLLTARLL